MKIHLFSQENPETLEKPHLDTLRPRTRLRPSQATDLWAQELCQLGSQEP